MARTILSDSDSSFSQHFNCTNNNNNTMTKLSNARAIVDASSAVFGASLLIQLLQNAQLNDTALGQLDEAATTEAALGAAKAFMEELERASRTAAGANANGEEGGEPADAVVVARDGEQTGFAAAIATSKAAGERSKAIATRQYTVGEIEKMKAERKAEKAKTSRKVAREVVVPSIADALAAVVVAAKHVDADAKKGKLGKKN